ncbi:MAG TPA: nitrilase-related carbon-nitrogen hydrolase [Longimicrobiales bacterium]
MSIWPDPELEQLRLSLLQFAPALRQQDANHETIRRLLRAGPADLALTPELSLTGYDLRDAAAQVASSVVRDAGFTCPALVGTVESANGGLLYNVAVLTDAHTSRVVHRKVYLPTYGMFDEGRYFGRGNSVTPITIGGWRIGVLICEDFWHPALTYLLAMQGIHALLVMAAAPGRGAAAGGEDGGFFASSDSWERIARTTAQLYGIYVAVCNRCGVEGGITFAGESLVVAPDTHVLARAGVQEARIDVVLEKKEIVRARRPYAHLRDEDTRLVAAELARISSHV